MKKALALLLALVMCLSLCACGDKNETAKPSENTSTPPSNNTEGMKEPSETVESQPEETGMTREEILETGTLIDALEFYEEVDGNIVRAESLYDGKPVLFREWILEVQREYIVVGVANTRIKVYLETEDIAQVTKDQFVFIAGILSNIDTGSEYSLPYASAEMLQGFLVCDTDAEQIYNNAKKLAAEGNYGDAIVLLKHLDGYSDSHNLLLETVCTASFVGDDSRDAWKSVFEKDAPTPLTGAEIEEIMAGDWYTGEGAFSTYAENGDFLHRGGEANGFVWFVENDRLIRESEYTRSEIVIYPFYNNAYVFCLPYAYNKVTDDVFELHFRGPLE